MSRAVSSALASSAADTGGTGGSLSNEKEASEGPLSFAGPLSNTGEISTELPSKGRW